MVRGTATFSPDTDSDADQRLDPAANAKPAHPDNASDLQKQEQFDRRLNDMVDKDPALQDLKSNGIKGREEFGDNLPNYKQQHGEWEDKYSPAKHAQHTKNQLANLVRGRGRKGILGASLVLLLSAAGVSMFSPMLAPFAIVESLTFDLDDKLPAMQSRSVSAFRNKLISQRAASGVITGCTKLSIRCKAKTLSKPEVTRLARAGIEVSSTETRLAGRVVPDSFSFRGQTYTPEQWKAELGTNQTARNAQLRANNMRYIGFSDKAFIGSVLKRFGLTKNPPGLKGSAKDRLNQILTRTGASSAADVQFRPAQDADGNDTDKFHMINSDGNPVTNPSTGQPIEYTQSQVDGMRNHLSGATGAQARAPSKAGAVAIGSLSAIAYYDLACTAKNLLGAATVAAKVSMQTELVKFSWDLVSRVHKLKAVADNGTTIEPEDYEAIGKFFTDTDNLATITDIQKSYETKETVEKPNPGFGKSTVDSDLILMSINGGVANKTETSSMFTLGGGASAFLSGVEGATNILDDVLNAGTDDKVCNIVQNPIVRGIGIAATIAFAVSSGGSSLGGQVAQIAPMIAGITLLNLALNTALQGSIADLLEGRPGEATGAAFWTGTAAFMGEGAKAHGLKPASADEIVEYRAVAQQVKDDYIALAREDAQSSPFDITNQYSILGSVANSVAHSFNYRFNSSSLIKIPTLLSSSLSSVAYAEKIDQSRFEQCDDESYEELGIAADVQCNVRYVLSEVDLAKDGNAVIDWMEENGYVARDTETGLPEGYTPPDPAQAQNALVSFVRGATVGQFVAERPLPNEYAYYLEHCVYRTLPWGETFQESGLIGAAGEDWVTGKKCREDTEMLSNFRVYTLDRSIEEGVSNEGIESEVGDPASSGDVQVSSGSAVDNAKKLANSPNFDISSKYKSQITNTAAGNTSCHVDPRILAMLASLVDKYKIYVSSLNRQCTNTLTASGISSLHYFGQGGRAVDIAKVDGVASTGANSNDIRLINDALALIPSGTKVELGQRACGGGQNGVITPPGIDLKRVLDTCNHIHIGVY